jgi:hypothetical protein
MPGNSQNHLYFSTAYNLLCPVVQTVAKNSNRREHTQTGKKLLLFYDRAASFHAKNGLIFARIFCCPNATDLCEYFGCPVMARLYKYMDEDGRG